MNNQKQNKSQKPEKKVELKDLKARKEIKGGHGRRHHQYS
jgi:hypothetical protein